MTANRDDRDRLAPARAPRSRLRRLLRSKDGAAAIEFALLAIPYFVIVFAIIETFVAYTAEQLVGYAADKLARQLRTGEITYNLGLSTDKNEAQFRQLFCDEIAILISCAASPGSLWIDVKSYTSFANLPTAIPRKDPNDPHSELDTAGFTFTPGGAGSINMVRAFYQWQVVTDLVRPLVSTSSQSNTFLITALSAFRNEAYAP